MIVLVTLRPPSSSLQHPTGLTRSAWRRNCMQCLLGTPSSSAVQLQATPRPPSAGSRTGRPSMGRIASEALG
jgi:hypothetical protein